MKAILTFSVIALISMAVFSLYVRFAPLKVSDWDVDAQYAELPSSPNAYKVEFLLDFPLSHIADRWVAPALGREKSKAIAGAVNNGTVTYEVRTAVIGFPDYVSIKLVEEGGTTRAYVFSRSRYGYSDLGRNKDRIEHWRGRLEAAL